METYLTNDRFISFYRNRVDYKPSPINTLQFAYEDGRYDKMTRELNEGSDILRLKTLNEINEDFRRSDSITLAILSSNILLVLLNLIKHEDNQIRELSIRAIVIIYFYFYNKKIIIFFKYPIK